MSSATSARRFCGTMRCPVCNGADDDPRGEGKRCHGWVSDDDYAHCSREEFAGECRVDPSGTTWAHRIGGPCRCGEEHAPPAPDREKTKRKTLGDIDRTYNYLGPDGNLVLQVVRYRNPKDFRQRRPDPGKPGRWVWNIKGVDPVPYRLPELAAADPGKWVMVPEGEKDVDRLVSFGQVATCNPQGAGKWKDQYSRWFGGRRVAILPDNDQVGRDHAQQVARSLAGIAAEVRVVELPGVPEKGDVSDYLDRLHSLEDLLALVEMAPAWTPPAEAPANAEPSSGGGERKDDRPVIVITTEEHRVNDQAIEALSNDPNIYQRGNSLVTVLHDEIRPRAASRDLDVARPPGSPRIARLQRARIRELMTKHARWNKIRKGDQDFEAVPAHPPDWSVNAVEARGRWHSIRPLLGVVEAPALRLDGSIIDRPGYDEQTGLLYMPNRDFPPIPGRPSREDAGKALALILDLVADFPFATDEHRAAWVAALLTPLARFAIDGPCPLFMFDANVPAAGKSSTLR